MTLQIEDFAPRTPERQQEAHHVRDAAQLQSVPPG